MAEGRGVLAGPNEMPPEPPSQRSGFSTGGYAQLRLIEGVDYRIILVRGKFQNRFVDSNTGLVVTAVEPFLRAKRHSIPPAFQTSEARRKTWDEKRGKSRWLDVICTKGPDPMNPQRCIPCQIVSYPGAAKDRKVFQALHLGAYHLTPKKNNAKETFPKICYANVPDIECKGCKEGYPTIDAVMRYLDLTNTDYQVLSEQNTFLRNKCVCGGQLGTSELVCSRCNRSLLRYSAENKTEFLKAMSAGTYYCEQCGVRVPLAEVKACQARCATPAPLSIFNSVLTVRRSRPPGKNYTQIQVMEAAPAGDLLIKYAKELDQKLDLEAIFAGSIPEQQKLVQVQPMPGAEGLGERR